jgi:hypothetical protein
LKDLTIRETQTQKLFNYRKEYFSMAQKQQQRPQPLKNRKGWAKDDVMAYKQGKTLILEKDGDIIETVEMQDTGRDSMGKLYRMVSRVC